MISQFRKQAYQASAEPNSEAIRLTSEKIASFGSLPTGWHYGSGQAAEPATISEAVGLNVLFYYFGITETDAFPGADGEILLRGYHHDNMISITFETNNTLTVIAEANGWPTDFVGISYDAALGLIGGIVGKLCATSGSSIQSTMTPVASVLPSLRSKNLPETDVLPSSRRPVLSNGVDASRTISNSIIQGSVDTRQYFGVLTPSGSHLEAR